MKKNIMTALLFVLALALVVLSIGLTPATATAFVPIMFIVMAAYCVSQYKYGKLYR